MFLVKSHQPISHYVKELLIFPLSPLNIHKKKEYIGKGEGRGNLIYVYEEHGYLCY